MSAADMHAWWLI